MKNFKKVYRAWANKKAGDDFFEGAGSDMNAMDESINETVASIIAELE